MSTPHRPRGVQEPVVWKIRAVVLAGVLFAVSPTIFATQVVASERPPAAGAVQRIEVTVVDVDVAAVDREGRPALGLTPADFRLEVDGAPVAITNFSPPAARGGVAGEGGADSERAARPRYLVILFDTRSGRSLQRNEAFRALAEGLPRLAAGDRRLMVALQDAALRVVHAFTDDPALLPQRLHEVGAAPTLASSLISERQVLASAMQNAFVVSGDLSQDGDRSDWAFAVSEAGGLLPRLRSYASNLRDEQRARIQSLGRLLASLAGLPGQKSLLYVGGGFEAEPGLDLFQLWAQRCPQLAVTEKFIPDLEAQHYQLGEELAALVNSANAASVSVYTMFTEQSGALVSMGIDRALPSGGSSVLARRDRSVDGSLGFLADATGGFPLGTGRAGAKGIDNLAETLDGVYSLGFAPPADAGAGPHRITVHVRREGVRARHRHSYNLRSLDELMTERTYAALLFGQQPAVLGGEIAVDEITPQPDGTYHATIAATVPLARLALVPAKNAHEGRVAVFYATRDGQGRVSPLRSQAFPVRILNSGLFTALGQQATFAITIAVPAGRHSVAVSVLDELAASSSTLVIDFETTRNDSR